MSVNRLACKLPKDLQAAVASSLEDWKKNNKVARLWQKDASLWSNTDESNWLGWLSICEEQLANIEKLKQLAGEVKTAKFKHVLACIWSLLRSEEPVYFSIRRHKFSQHSHILTGVASVEAFDRDFSSSFDDSGFESIANHSARRASFESPAFYLAGGVLHVEKKP